jgi:hypothetical protein
MPVYYFDIRDAEGMHGDAVGVELTDMDAAIAEARRTLAEMSQESIGRGAADGPLEILIRDHGEGPVRLTLTLETERPRNNS